MFFWNSLAFSMIQRITDVGNLISGSSAFSKTSLNIWKFTVHILLKPGLENFEHYFTSVWDEFNCVVVWTVGAGDGQGGLECCSPWGHKESDTTQWLNWTDLIMTSPLLFLFLQELIEFAVNSPGSVPVSHLWPHDLHPHVFVTCFEIFHLFDFSTPVFEF